MLTGLCKQLTVQFKHLFRDDIDIDIGIGIGIGIGEWNAPYTDLRVMSPGTEANQSHFDLLPLT